MTLPHYSWLRCRICGGSRWTMTSPGVRCEGCGAEIGLVEGGVLALAADRPDDVGEFYDEVGGPHFMGSSFAQNMHIFFTTRSYERTLGAFLPAPAPKSRLVDLGCGDGRFSLWALRAGFGTVVAVDRTLAPLQRLLTAAEPLGGRDRLMAVQASFDDDRLAPGGFDAALAIEAFTYLGSQYPTGLTALRRLLTDDGIGVVSEFGRSGRLLSDVIAVNLENMEKISREGRRFEKFGRHKLVQRLFTVDELVKECEAAGLAVVDRRGVSPLPMLFQYVYTFTSYPLRPPLDAAAEKLLEALEEQTSTLSDFSRNVVLRLRKAG